MAVDEAVANKATKPSGNLDKVNVAQGMEKPKASKGEVVGNTSPGAYYACWFDNAVNWVDRGYDFFICWECYHINRC